VKAETDLAPPVFIITITTTILCNGMRESGCHASAINDCHQDAINPPPADEDSHSPSVRQARQGDLEKHTIRIQHAVLKFSEQIQTLHTVVCIRLVAFQIRPYVLLIE